MSAPRVKKLSLAATPLTAVTFATSVASILALRPLAISSVTLPCVSASFILTTGAVAVLLSTVIAVPAPTLATFSLAVS